MTAYSIIFPPKENQDMIDAFGSVAVTIMFLTYWLEPRSRWYVLAFAAGSALTAVYSGIVEAYPITVIESLWAMIALRRFVGRSRAETSAPVAA
ncbi:MAG: hypothetical protein O3A47_03555 [Chloroflexi bacterium]|nr:hypothetical protein [Chloroflexota bacterium]